MVAVSVRDRNGLGGPDCTTGWWQQPAPGSKSTRPPWHGKCRTVRVRLPSERELRERTSLQPASGTRLMTPKASVVSHTGEPLSWWSGRRPEGAGKSELYAMPKRLEDLCRMALCLDSRPNAPGETRITTARSRLRHETLPCCAQCWLGAEVLPRSVVGLRAPCGRGPKTRKRKRSHVRSLSGPPIRVKTKTSEDLPR